MWYNIPAWLQTKKISIPIPNLCYKQSSVKPFTVCKQGLLYTVQQGGVIQHFLRFLKSYKFLLIRYIFRSKKISIFRRSQASHAQQSDKPYKRQNVIIGDQRHNATNVIMQQHHVPTDLIRQQTPKPDKSHNATNVIQVGRL